MTFCGFDEFGHGQRLDVKGHYLLNHVLATYFRYIRSGNLLLNSTDLLPLFESVRRIQGTEKELNIS